MPRWSFSRRQKPSEKEAPAVKSAGTPPVAKPAGTPPVAKPAPVSAGPARRVSDSAPDRRPPQAQLEEANATQLRLRQDLAELLKAHRQQSRVLERNQKLLEQTEQELARQRSRAGALETEIAEQRAAADQHEARVHELEQI